MKSRLSDGKWPRGSVPTSASMWSTSIDVKSLQEHRGSGLAMRTKGTISVWARLIGWVGDAITTVLLEGVGGGSEDWGALVWEATEGRARPRVDVVVWRAEDGGGGAEGLGRAAWGDGPGPALPKPEEAKPSFFFLGTVTHFRAICLPNTTKASPSCLLVPCIETKCSQWPLISCEWTKIQALDISATCFRPCPLCPTICPTRSSARTREVEKRSGEDSLGWCAKRGVATSRRVVV